MKKNIRYLPFVLLCLSATLQLGCGARATRINPKSNLDRDGTVDRSPSTANPAVPNPPKPKTPSPKPSAKPSTTPQPSPTPSNPPVPPGSEGAWGQSGAIVNTTVEFQTQVGFHTDNHHTSVWHYQGSTYFVWVDSNFRPKVTKITNGRVESVFLDPGSDYKARNDGHHRFSMGIDTNGYLHITGDMHNYSGTTTSNSDDPYPTRYQKQSMLYWKSRQPESVSGGFVFAGGKGVSTTLPGSSWTYGRFFTDTRGELYYSSRVEAIDAGHFSGEMGLGVYKYNTSSRTWTALGGEADKIRDGKYYKVLLWEIGGAAPGKWYQTFRPQIKFDSANRMHLAVAINTDTSLAKENRVIYAVSLDGGFTWRKANGDRIPGLPIRAADGKLNQGDLVFESQLEELGGELGVVADKGGKPGVIVQQNLGGIMKVWNWNGSKWLMNNDLIGDNVPQVTSGSLSLNNSMVLTMHRAGKFLHTHSFNKLAYGYDVPDAYDFDAIDEYGLRTTGDVYGIRITDYANMTESVLKTTISSAPLPCGWKSTDIFESSGPGYAGLAGFADKKFVVTDYGARLDSNNDSFHYVYGQFSGDGSITARVESTTPKDDARAGVMMRETLTPNSKHAMMTIAPKKGAFFGSRSSVGGTTNLDSSTGISNPYWVKLTRAGNTFTGSISSDGKTWKETGKATVSMASTIYVGLAAASYHRYGMQTAKFENVSAPRCQP